MSALRKVKRFEQNLTIVMPLTYIKFVSLDLQGRPNRPGASKKKKMAKTKKGANIKKQILKTAIELFSKNGYEDTSFRNIAQGLEINHAIISYHFGSKIKLFYEVVKTLSTEMELLQNRLVFDDKKDHKESFKVHIKLAVKYLSEHPELMRIIYLESLSDSPRKEKVMELIGLRRLFSLEYLKEVKERGLIPDVSLEEFSFILHGMVITRFMHPVLSEALTGRSNIDDAVIEEYAQTIISVLIK